MNIRAGPIFVAEREWKDVHAVAAKVNHIIQISCYSYNEPPFAIYYRIITKVTS